MSEKREQSIAAPAGPYRGRGDAAEPAPTAPKPTEEADE